MAQAPDNKATLGCGTLILIALIVAIFSRDSNIEEIKKDVQQLKREVRDLSFGHKHAPLEYATAG